jgi:CRISPR-associated protein Cas4
LIIIISILIKNKTNKIKINNKIQNGKIIYSDLNKPAKSLFSKNYRIVGKPDYIIIKNNRYIPVEIKSGNHTHPENSHIYQLMTYCQLIEDNYNCYSPYGIIVYPDASKEFKIRFDPKRRFELLSIVKEMRKSLHNEKMQRNHNEIKRCINCSLREKCNYKLG